MPQFCDLKKPLQKKDICGVKLERPYVLCAVIPLSLTVPMHMP
jgi:hypothetical protein